MRERKPPPPLDAPALFDLALRALSRRAMTLGEVRERLRRRAASPDLIEPTLARLKEYGYLDDQRFADQFTALRRENRGHGRMRVLRDLRVRRVAPGLAEETVARSFAGEDEAALVEAYLERKYRATNLTEHLADEKRLASVYRRLRGAGYSHGVSVNVLMRHARAAERLQEIDPPDEAAAEPT